MTKRTAGLRTALATVDVAGATTGRAETLGAATGAEITAAVLLERVVDVSDATAE